MYTYSPSDVSVTFAGINISGFSDKDVVKIKRESPLYSSRRAMDGTVEVTQQRYSRWSVTISLAQSSPSNDFLFAVQQFFAENRVMVMEYLPLIIKDNSGTTFFFAKDVWIEEVPEIAFKDTLETREWALMCNNVVCNIGGNTDSVGSITEVLAAFNTVQAVYTSASSAIRGIGAML